MKKSTIGVVIAATVLIVSGIGLFIGGMMAAGGVDAAKDIIVGNGINGMFDINWDEDGFDIDFEAGNQGKIEESGTVASEKQNYSDMEPITFGMEDVKSLYLETKGAEIEVGGNSNGEFVVRTDGKYEIYVRNEILYIKSKGIQDEHKMLIEIPTLQVPGEMLFEEVEMKADACDISMDQISAKEFDLEIGAGRIEIGQLVAEYGEFDVGAGEIIVTYGNMNECDVNVDMGNFEYTGMILRHGDVECNMGNTAFDLERGVEDYNFEIECGAGNVSIGNQNFSGLGTEKFINNQVQEQFDIECNMGNVSINAED
ncbi:MAG: DUF4097 family beta strand repeat protein [Lachnospiraceae bacterium]|nr:DUF4097 family beta strand repeat protein [Lachnospiraceae bacterium]